MKASARQGAVAPATRFVQLLRDNVPPHQADARVYNMLVSVCVAAQDVPAALAAGEMLRSTGRSWDAILYTNIITGEGPCAGLAAWHVLAAEGWQVGWRLCHLGPCQSVMHSMQCGAVMRSCWRTQRDSSPEERVTDWLCLHQVNAVAVWLQPLTAASGVTCCKCGTCPACSELPAPCPQPVHLWRTLRQPSGCMESYGRKASAQTARCTLLSSRRAAGASRAVLATSAGGHMLRIRQAHAHLCKQWPASALGHSCYTARICISGPPRLPHAQVWLRAACKRYLCCLVAHMSPHVWLCTPHMLRQSLLQNCWTLFAGVTSWCYLSRPRRCLRTCKLPACAQTQLPGTP